jgi:hypothetical protein
VRAVASAGAVIFCDWVGGRLSSGVSVAATGLRRAGEGVEFRPNRGASVVSPTLGKRTISSPFESISSVSSPARLREIVESRSRAAQQARRK